jgi:hypothetical protein
MAVAAACLFALLHAHQKHVSHSSKTRLTCTSDDAWERDAPLAPELMIRLSGVFVVQGPSVARTFSDSIFWRVPEDFQNTEDMGLAADHADV